MGKKNFQKGFTLIELLVVISIIALLASIVLASLATARKKAQDAQVLSEMSQIADAMEIYNLSKNGYPNPSPGSANLYCIGATSCEVCGTVISSQLSTPGFTFSNVTTPVVTSSCGANQGYVYLTCGLNTATCPSGNGYVLSTTNQLGTFSETVGLWQNSPNLPTLPSSE